MVKKPRKVLRQLRASLRALDEAIYTKDDLDSVTVSVDSFASLLAEWYGMTVRLTIPSASELFSELESHGVPSDVSELASTLEEIASMTIYDDDEDGEIKLEEAEDARQGLYDRLNDLVEAIDAHDE
jgi:hypothetical protein